MVREIQVRHQCRRAREWLQNNQLPNQPNQLANLRLPLQKLHHLAQKFQQPLHQ
jgi:arsenate reductase-like glutaredoxin family protein